MIGRTVSHYQILEKLGAGGMGEVYLAEDTRLGRKVALKFLALELAFDHQALTRFRGEARAAAELSHPNIATLYDIGEDEGRPFIVMEYLSGQTLGHRIAQGPLAVEEALSIGGAIAAGLAEAHSHGIVHRDIKSANVMLTDTGEVKILDFGLARRAEATEFTKSGVLLGTFRYMSPEQTTGKHVDHRTDLFSLGVTLYEMLTGTPAFHGSDPAATLYAVAHTDPEPPTRFRQDLPHPLVELVDTLLKKSPEDRPRNTHLVARELGKMNAALSRGEAAPPLSLDESELDATIPAYQPPRVSTDSPRFGSRGGAWKLVAGIFVVAALAWGISEITDRDPVVPDGEVVSSENVAPGRQLALFPFSFEGASDATHYGVDMVRLLDATLDGTGDFSIVKTDSLLQHIEGEGLDATDPEVAHRLAQEFGADRYVTGTIRTVGNGLQIEAQLRGGSGAILMTARGLADDASQFPDLVDRIGVQLLEGLFDQLFDGIRRMALREAGSTDALRAFLRGVAHEGQESEEAFVAYQEAASLDSTFALALFKLSQMTFRNAEDLVEARAIANQAYRHRNGLSREFQLLVEGWREETLGNIDRAEQLYRSVLHENPNSLDANYLLAELLWDNNAYRGRPMTEAIPFYERILGSQRTPPEVFTVLSFAYFTANDMVSMERTHQAQFGGPPNLFWRYMMACAGEDRERQDALATELGFERVSAGGRTFMGLVIACVPDNHQNLLVHYNRAPDSLLTPLTHLLTDATRGFVEAGLGRWAEARRALDRIPPEFALHVAEHKAMLMAVPVLDVPAGEIQQMIEALQTWPKTDRGIVFDMGADFISYTRFQPHFEIHDHILLYLLALLHARIGDLERAWSYSRELDATEVPEGWELAVENLRVGARATIDYTAGDYRSALAHLDAPANQTPQEKYALFTNRTWEIFLRGLVLSRLGRGRDALPWFQRQPNEFAFVLDAPGHLERARIHDELGDVQLAIDYYTRFINLWKDADPGLQPQVEAAQERVTALTGQ